MRHEPYEAPVAPTVTAVDIEGGITFRPGEDGQPPTLEPVVVMSFTTELGQTPRVSIPRRVVLDLVSHLIEVADAVDGAVSDIRKADPEVLILDGEVAP